MTVFSRAPCNALAPWVECLWATRPEPALYTQSYRERVLPTGSMHLVLRLSGAPLVLFDDASTERSNTLGYAIVGGARSNHYVKQVGDKTCSVGVQLRPGASFTLLGASANALAGQHVPLDALWGHDAPLLCERLIDVAARVDALHRGSDVSAGLRAQVDVMEAVLLARVRGALAPRRHAEMLARAMASLDVNVPLAAIVAQSGVSHRTFITRFQELVGMSPKVFARVRRFQRVVAVLGRHDVAEATVSEDYPAHGRAPTLAQLAFDAGYADQAHLCRDFLEFSGITPSSYNKLAPAAPNHVPVNV